MQCATFNEFKDKFFSLSKIERKDLVISSKLLLNSTNIANIINFYEQLLLEEDNLEEDINFYLEYLINMYKKDKLIVNIYKGIQSENLKTIYLNFISKSNVEISMDQLRRILVFETFIKKIEIIDQLDKNIKQYNRMDELTFILLDSNDIEKIFIFEKLIRKYIGILTIDVISFILSKFNNDKSKCKIIKILIKKFKRLDINKENFINLLNDCISDKMYLDKILKALKIPTIQKIYYDKYIYSSDSLRLNDKIIFFKKDGKIMIIKKKNNMLVQFFDEQGNNIKNKSFRSNFYVESNNAISEKKYRKNN